MKNFFCRTTVSLILFFSFCQLHGQIICTDVNPDITNTGNFTQDIDLNNDLTPDFRITSAQAGNLSFVVVQGSQIGTGNFVLTNGSGSTQCLPLNAPISPTSTTWTQMNGTNQQMIIVTNGVGTGPWTGAIDQYLGLKLIVGLNTYYGWARFTFQNNTNTYTYKDYAYNSVSGQQILAGQGCGSLQNPTFSMPVNVCVGGSVSVTANTGTGIPTSFNWVGIPVGPVFTSSNSASTNITFTSAGTYTIMLVVGSGTIFGITQNTVLVGFTSTVTNNSPLCSGQTLSMSATGGSAYAWIGPNSFTSIAQSPTISPALPINSGIYSVVAISPIGCIAQLTTNVLVNALPTITLSPASPTVCLGGTVNLTAAGQGTAFNWSPPAGLNTTTGASVTATVTAQQAYSVVTTNTNGCSNSTMVTVNVQSPATFSIVGNNFWVCSNPFNGSPSITTIAILGGIGYSFSAITATNLSPSVSGNTLSFATVPPYNYQGSSNFTIQGNNGICAMNLPFSILFMQNPTVNISPTSVSICAQQTAAIIASGAITYSWANVLGLNNYTSGTVQANPTISTVYSVFGSSLGCNSTSQNVSVTVNPNPTVTVASATVCTGQAAVLTGNGASSYTWATPGGSSSVSVSVIFASLTPTLRVYNVTGVNAEGCTAVTTASVSVITCAGLEENDFNIVQIYPNPVGDILYAEINARSPLKLQIIDLSGKIVLENEFPTSDARVLNTNTGALQAGFYLVRITSDGKTGTFKMVKE